METLIEILIEFLLFINAETNNQPNRMIFNGGPDDCILLIDT